MLPRETQLGGCTWALLFVLVVLVVVVAVLALNSTVTALQHRAARAKLSAPPTQPFRDVDSSTSGDQLAQQAQCPRTAPSGLVTRVGGSTQPFIVLHELHVGEQWLVKLLQVRRGSRATSTRHPTATMPAHRSQARTGVRVLVGQAKDGKAQKAVHEWLSAVMSAASSRGAALIILRAHRRPPPRSQAPKRAPLPPAYLRVSPRHRLRVQEGRRPAAPPTPTPRPHARSGSCSLRARRAR